jgi:hypothetical protein
MQRFRSSLVSVAGSGVSWVDERGPVHHDPKEYEFLHLTHYMCTGLDEAEKFQDTDHG